MNFLRRDHRRWPGRHSRPRSTPRAKKPRYCCSAVLKIVPCAAPTSKTMPLSKASRLERTCLWPAIARWKNWDPDRAPGCPENNPDRRTVSAGVGVRRSNRRQDDHLRHGGIQEKAGRARGKGTAGPGSVICVDCDANFYRGATVTVVGDRSAAVDGALTLLGYAAKVYLVSKKLDASPELLARLRQSQANWKTPGSRPSKGKRR